MAKFWTWCKTNLFKFIGALIMDDREGVQVLSLGRVLLGIVFVVMMISWHREKPELPGGILEVFYALLGYVFGTKAVQVGRSWVDTKAPSSPKTSEEPPKEG